MKAMDNLMESKFTGGVLGNIGISLLQGLLIIITLGIGTPWAICMRQRWICRHTWIDGYQLVFVGKGLGLLGHFLLWGLLTVITIGIFGLWVPIKFQRWITVNTHHVVATQPTVPPTQQQYMAPAQQPAAADSDVTMLA